ncbi:MAG: hypothetical protein A2583_03525 [Bdellovibrionales bacterium RIFOXYD1_FULL_53_11]|nr:MAG: hypothetical protein A2583_03525 [Bdellovibrionales bacterium RIFOXYD1_FULL_53_11]
MIEHKLFPFVFLFPAVIACSTAADSVRDIKSYDHSFQTVRSLSPETAKESDILEVLGPPDLKADLKDQRHGWLYLDKLKQTTHASVIFCKKGGSLESINWFPQPDEDESSIANVKKLFPNLAFTEKELPWKNPHYNPDKYVLENTANGIRIVHNKKNVEVITFGGRPPPG